MLSPPKRPKISYQFQKAIAKKGKECVVGHLRKFQNNPFWFVGEKKIPSTAAKATSLSPNVAVAELIQRNAQSAFFLTHGRVSIALKKKFLR